ncbi:rhodanese-like domain-containing protein [Chryseobacterium sp. POL2]|uniref:rhodanese-like domain-containing protein n=1 Tax=Chryseobacterium sp. POL2 TaxID=2713414 RepID=UPI0013E19ED5|nr:rhodanese-like domain-containing protein [Chryseobacterium sp. POL2]QIG88145.1 rhodanese-like domain-containing protein [Chryseobacterium sp. POL2]
MAIEDILLSGNYHLIDVREPMELEMDGHIEEAQNIPLGELEDRKQEILNLSGTKIFFCRSGNRSGKATEYFKAEGLTDVYNGGAYSDLSEVLENLKQ